MAAIDEKRAQFQRYKEDVQARGKPFFPYAVWHDTVMSLVVVSTIIALACIWYFTSGEKPEDTGLLGPRYVEEADPGTTNFVPRPDWYFFFLFYLLRIFKWPDSVILGTVGIPTIALILLIALPFLDLRRERLDESGGVRSAGRARDPDEDAHYARAAARGAVTAPTAAPWTLRGRSRACGGRSPGTRRTAASAIPG